MSREHVKGAKLDVKIFDPSESRTRLCFPVLNGGSDYGGASFDASRGLLFVNSMDVGGLFRLVKRGKGQLSRTRLQCHEVRILYRRKMVILVNSRPGARSTPWISTPATFAGGPLWANSTS